MNWVNELCQLAGGKALTTRLRNDRGQDTRVGYLVIFLPQVTIPTLPTLRFVRAYTGMSATLI